MLPIRIENVSKEFPASAGRGTTVAVDGVSLDIAAGALFFLLGPSGCGKTTLLRMLAGFVSPTAGRIFFGEREMTGVPPHQRDTGMVFQSYALWPHMSVAQNVAFGLECRRMKNPERQQRVREALALVQLAEFAERRPNQLSGGQQQRVALARALAIRPTRLLLDEPLSNLDAKLRLDVRGEIRRIVKDAGTTAIYVTHDQKEALSMADGIALMNAGRLEQVGTPMELYRKPRTRFAAGFIGESNFLEGTVEAMNSSTVTIKTSAGPLIAARPADRKLQTGQQITAAFRPESLVFLDGGIAGANVNRLRGKHLSTTYLGEMAEHLVALEPGAQNVKAFENNPRRNLKAGQGTVLLLAPEDIVMVDA